MVFLKHVNKILDHTVLMQLLHLESDCCRISNVVHHPKSDKFLQVLPVINLDLMFFLIEVEQLWQNEHLEQNQRFYPCALCVVLTLWQVNIVKKRAESFPWN